MDSSHRWHFWQVGLGAFAIRCRYLFSGMCPVCSWNSRDEWRWGSPALSFMKCFEGADWSIFLRRGKWGDCCITAFALFLIMWLNCCFKADLLIGSVSMMPFLLTSDFGRDWYSELSCLLIHCFIAWDAMVAWCLVYHEFLLVVSWNYFS